MDTQQAIYADEGWDSVIALAEFSKRYRADKAFKGEVDGGKAPQLLREAGLHIPEGYEIKVAADTATTIHVVMPADPNTDLEDETLGAVVGGDTAGSASTLGTAGSMTTSCMVSTISTAGSAGTAGSAS